ncbi:mediator of RNA polymerase II transcription subunit 8-B-like [Ostrea edulis]|uniref:mediator of RNA polymerase II transcription subunit 8-B-like n=1 Tax=Ostrea edulis TaxID=37623 RepID=UPI0024AEC6C8|nr:mediator of RNA polymerase II transcription subunit 8-B-like [Ostrea edulis]
MQKEEKQLEHTVESLIQRVQDIKNSIANFLLKLENEYNTLHWPTVLDNFALLSGQLNTLGKLLRNEKVPPLRNSILLPIALSGDRDPELEKITERRVIAFNADVVPHYLRTKPEPEVEERLQPVLTRASTLTTEMAQKQINAMNKMTSNIVDIIKSHQETMEKEANQKSSLSQTSSQADTNTLLSAVLTGKGFKSTSMRRADISQQQNSMQAQQQAAQQKAQGNSVGKVPSSIKTNIKQGSSSHPYQRNLN